MTALLVHGLAHGDGRRRGRDAQARLGLVHGEAQEGHPRDGPDHVVEEHEEGDEALGGGDARLVELLEEHLGVEDGVQRRGAVAGPGLAHHVQLLVVLLGALHPAVEAVLEERGAEEEAQHRRLLHSGPVRLQHPPVAGALRDLLGVAVHQVPPLHDIVLPLEEHLLLADGVGVVHRLDGQLHALEVRLHPQHLIHHGLAAHNGHKVRKPHLRGRHGLLLVRGQGH
mmetsp:Transcript_24872/g.74032  ORF Transcript_24872/g.74032 Transcript_24872/m.74032 type:complete len:226 (-) Transcript_24872:499-1176(-)